MQQPGNVATILFDSSYSETEQGYARNTADSIEWCRGWEISGDGRAYVLYDMEHAALNIECLQSARALLQKAGIWTSLPYREIIDKMIADSKMILALMVAAEQRHGGGDRGGASPSSCPG